MANRKTNEQIVKMCEDAKALGFRPERLILLDKKLTEWSKTKETPSIVARILRHGELAFEGAYGILGPEKEPDSLTADAIFPICSITKPVISTLISIMQEEGLVDINYPVRDFIPEFKCDPDGNIRIWHFLTHTSGIIEDDFYKYFDEYVKQNIDLPLPDENAPDEAWDEIALKVREQLDLPYMEPGEAMRQSTLRTVCLTAPPTHGVQKHMSYCSLGFELIAEIIVKISGKNIDEYASEKLFIPLKMKDSHFIFPREKLPRYVTRGSEYVGSDWLNGGILNSESGGGGLKSTAADITRLGQMYLNGGKLDNTRVLSRASINEITRDHNFKVSEAVYDGQTFDSTWGLGWNIRGRKQDDSGMLRSSGSFEHGGFGCTKILCDPVYDINAAFFTVAIKDTYPYASLFYNMVIGALND